MGFSASPRLRSGQAMPLGFESAWGGAAQAAVGIVQAAGRQIRLILLDSVLELGDPLAKRDQLAIMLY